MFLGLLTLPTGVASSERRQLSVRLPLTKYLKTKSLPPPPLSTAPPIAEGVAPGVPAALPTAGLHTSSVQLLAGGAVTGPCPRPAVALGALGAATFQ